MVPLIIERFQSVKYLYYHYYIVFRKSSTLCQKFQNEMCQAERVSNQCRSIRGLV